MDNINHISYRLCSKNLSEDHSFEQLSLLKCAEPAHIFDRSSYTPKFKAWLMCCSSFSPSRAEHVLRRTELRAGHHSGGQCNHFIQAHIRSQKRKEKKTEQTKKTPKDSKCHFNRNLKKSVMVFLWACK